MLNSMLPDLKNKVKEFLLVARQANLFGLAVSLYFTFVLVRLNGNMHKI